MKILFITANRLGDAVLSTGVLNYLIKRYPSAAITLACGPLPAPLFRSVPGISHVHVLSKQPRWGHWRGLWSQIRGQKWDIAVDLRGSLLTYGLWCRQRFIYRSTHVKYHRVMDLARMIAPQSDSLPRIFWPHIWVDEQAKQQADILLGRCPVPPLIVGPTANWVGKQWPGDRFARVCDQLTKKGGILEDAPVVVLGAERDTSFFHTIQTPHVVPLIGQTDVLTAYAILCRGQCYFGNDSGLMHMAAASGIPTLGLFGPSQDRYYSPWGPNCAIVRTPETYDEITARAGFDFRSQNSYMETLTEDAVCQALYDLLARHA